MQNILGIDVGGSKIALGLVDDQLKLDDLKLEPTSTTDFSTQIVELIKKQKDYDAIGITMPGPVLPDGTVVRLPNIPSFQSTNLKKLLEEQFKVPVVVVNDAKAFAYAEANFGSAQNEKVVAGVILGTGVGVGIVMDKKIYFGKDGEAGEFEHVTLPDGKIFRNIRHSVGHFKEAADVKAFLKSLFDMIILSFNPDAIVLGGGWSNLPGMEELANELTTNVGNYENQTPVRISKLEYPGLLGAAKLALEAKATK